MINPPDSRIDESIGGPRRETAPSQGAGAATFTGWLRRVLAIVDDALACIDHWQRVSRAVQSLLLLDDAKLKAMGLKRNEVVPRVLQDFQARDAQARDARARDTRAGRAQRNAR